MRLSKKILYLLVLGVLCPSLSALTCLEEGTALMADGSGLGKWFRGLGIALVDALANERFSGADWRKRIDVEALRRALDAPVVVTDQNDPVSLRNLYGEVKDGKVLFHAVGGPVIYINRYHWTDFFETGRPEFRAVLHLYLYVAGYDDRHYAFSSLVPGSAFPRSSPNTEKPRHSWLWDEAFVRDPETRRLENGDFLVLRKENPMVSYRGAHYASHPALMAAQSLERYTSEGELRWIYFPKSFPVIADYTLSLDYISFELSAVRAGPEGIAAAGVVSVQRHYAYAFFLRLDSAGQTQSFLPLVEPGEPVETHNPGPLCFGVPGKIEVGQNGEWIVSSEESRAVIRDGAVSIRRQR